MHKLKYTNARLLELAQEHFAKHKRPPTIKDFGAGLSTTIRKRFKTWENYIQTALKLPANSHHWTREELLESARFFWLQSCRFPTGFDLASDRRDLTRTISKLFGSTNTFLEEAIGDSPRIQILEAIRALTPPGCEQATPLEIRSHLTKTMTKTMTLPTNLLSMNCRQLNDDGYITGGKFDRTNWWKLTPRGIEFLETYGNNLKGGK
jgi:hypothetical protein